MSRMGDEHAMLRMGDIMGDFGDVVERQHCGAVVCNQRRDRVMNL